ncbi:hypothetical protein WCP94_003734 [Bilophila wadsworthia]|uniref:hypothetical protein n=1 Tax=Bilophila TaxID=35832 RepID=UPI0002238DE1|nr:hypothetical protein [Bilophila sp. 4_1_30]EGW42912.1 hypothetical protein HMPREF0178_00409 [Bilophila sp. 4_1_30]
MSVVDQQVKKGLFAAKLALSNTRYNKGFGAVLFGFDDSDNACLYAFGDGDLHPEATGKVLIQGAMDLVEKIEKQNKVKQGAHDGAA